MREHGIIARRELKIDTKDQLHDGVEEYPTLTDLDAQDQALRRGDEWEWGLSTERELGLENGLRRSDKSSDMRGHGIGDLGEASKA